MESTELDAQQGLDSQVASEPQTEQQDGFSLDGAIAEVRKLRKEAATYRVRAKELEDAKAAVEAEREKAKADIDALSLEARQLRLQLQMADRVVDAEKAMRLVEDKHVKDGQLDVDAFLADNPFLSKQKAVTVPPLNMPSGTAKNQKVTADNWFDMLKN